MVLRDPVITGSNVYAMMDLETNGYTDVRDIEIDAPTTASFGILTQEGTHTSYNGITQISTATCFLFLGQSQTDILAYNGL